MQLRHRPASSRHILVIGAGVSGLTTAFCLLREGMRVTVVTEKLASQVTSNVAGALWEWPPAVCRHHEDPVALSRAKAWCKASYGEFEELSLKADTGVFMRPATFYFRRPIEEDPRAFRKMNELKAHVRDFVHSPALIEKNGVNPACGVCDAYSHLTPMVDTDTYLNYLLGEVRRNGCRVVQHGIRGRLIEQEESLKTHFEADAIVNCAGIGSMELANDPMYPLRGALIRVHNTGERFPRITQAHCVALEGNSNEPGFIFIVPRGQDMLVLGGIAEPDEWGLDINFDNHEPIRKMYQRCVDFLPLLENAEIDPMEPLRVGLRPFRRQSIRLEREPCTDIVHNYGHGGSGVTLSWGCAREVTKIVKRFYVDQ
jgi:D-amino-acid oxidase